MFWYSLYVGVILSTLMSLKTVLLIYPKEALPLGVNQLDTQLGGANGIYLPQFTSNNCKAFYQQK